jgi:hypothetical protein
MPDALDQKQPGELGRFANHVVRHSSTNVAVVPAPEP